MTVDCAAGNDFGKHSSSSFCIGERFPSIPFLRLEILGVSTLPAGTGTELTTSRANLEDPRAVAGCHAKAPYGLDLAAEGSS